MTATAGLAVMWLAAAALGDAPAVADPPRPAGGATPSKAQPPRDGRAGVAAWRRGDYNAALAIWRPLAEAGDAEAQFNLAQAYRLGRGVPKDEQAAIEWYRRAAGQGLTPAEANYGLLLLEKDRDAAMPWLEKAAAKGDARAQYVVGTALFNGDPLPPDPVRAYALMSRAAASGLPQAVRSLGEMDQYLSLEQRQRGLALAGEMAKSPVRAASPPAPAASADPSPLAAPAARPPVPAANGGGRWRIQLGAFADSDRAEGLWRQVSAGNAVLAGKQRYLVKAGSVTRLQAGPFASRAEAERACATIRGGACFAAIAP